MQLQSNSDERIVVKIYDMMGTKVDDLETTSDNLKQISFGENYRIGFYLVTVKQGASQKTIRMFKKE